jgi:hypothetical protein
MKLIAMIAQSPAPAPPSAWSAPERLSAYLRVLEHVEASAVQLAAATRCEHAQTGDWSFSLAGEHLVPSCLAGRTELASLLREVGGEATVCRLLARPADVSGDRLVIDLVREACTSDEVRQILREHG